MWFSSSSMLRPVAAVLCFAATSVGISAQSASQNSIQLFSPVNVRASAAGTGYGAAAVNFNSNTLNLTCAASPITAILSSTPDSTGNLLVDNNINVTVTAGQTTNGPTNICVGGVNGSSIGIPFQNCFSSAFEFPPAGVNYLGQNPDTFVATGGVKPIDISSLLVPGSEQVTISLQDEGFYLSNSTLYLNTNCTQTGVTGPALVSGNPISSSNPTPDQLSQDFTFNPTNGQGIGFTYDLTAARAAGSLNIVDGTIPEVGDQPLDPAVYQSTFVPGTSFATSSCLVHSGELLSNGQPACKLYTLQCKLATGTDPSGAQCPISSIPNEIFQDVFDGPAFTLQDIGTPGGVTFHQGIGLLMAKEGWTGGPCTFDPASGLADQDCPQNLLTSFSSTSNSPQTQSVVAPKTNAKTAVHANAAITAAATNAPSSSYSSGGRTTRPNSTFISVYGIPEPLTTVTSNGTVLPPANISLTPYWFNTDPVVSFKTQPPTLTGATVPGAATFVPSPIQSLTYGISLLNAAPAPGEPVPDDVTVTNPNGCPAPDNLTTPAATSFSTGPVTFSGLAEGIYELHYFAQDCAGTEELHFLKDGSGNWSTSFYGAGVGVDRTPPQIFTDPNPGSFQLNDIAFVTYSCTDNLSGVAYCNGGNTQGSNRQFLNTSVPGTHELDLAATDFAGNTTRTAYLYNVAYPPADSQVQLTVSSSSITFPASVPVIAKILPGPHPASAPAGNVQLILDGSVVQTVSIQPSGGGTATAYLNLAKVAAGQHSLVANYSGDTYNPQGYSAPVTFKVSPSPVTLAVSCVNPAIPVGASFSCNVYTQPILAGSPGKITYTYDNGAPVSVAMSGGTASFSITSPAVGTHTVVVSYAAQGNYAAAPSQTTKFTVQAPK